LETFLKKKFRTKSKNKKNIILQILYYKYYIYET